MSLSILGYENYLRSYENFGDAYAKFIAGQHSADYFVQALVVERTEMYLMPQMSAIPAEHTGGRLGH